jgi:hypothetical protein
MASTRTAKGNSCLSTAKTGDGGGDENGMLASPLYK